MDVNDGHITQDSRVDIEFDQSSCASYRDQNLIEGKLGYIRKSLTNLVVLAIVIKT
jgi:hypothetical protein